MLDQIKTHCTAGTLAVIAKTVFSIVAAWGMLYANYYLCTLVPGEGFVLAVTPFIALSVWAFFKARKYKETGGREGIVVYRNYKDALKCLSVACIPILFSFIAIYSGGSKILSLAAILYMVGMFVHIAYQNAQINELKVLPFVLLVKMILAFIWVLWLFCMLTGNDKVDSRASGGVLGSLIGAALFAALTFFAHALILEDMPEAA